MRLPAGRCRIEWGTLLSPDRIVNPALSWLYSVQQFGIKPGLDNTRRLLRELQLPGSRQRFLHVAGTNGKGSVCAFMESILRCAGERTGLFTSPHLVSFCERMRMRGEMPGIGEMEEAITALRAVVSGWDPHPTFFELTLMLALDWLDRRGAEVIVLETGMGGRWDATNVLRPVVSVITPIAMDHEQWLGSTLAEIASEKAGIIKPGVPVVSSPQSPEAEEVLRRAAAEAGVPITIVREPWAGALPLAGEHQRWNAALAVESLRAAGFALPNSVIDEGLLHTDWPARFQILPGERIIIDGAHNPHGAAATVAAWKAKFGDERATVIFGAVAAKDYARSLELLAGIAHRFLFVTQRSPRAVSAEVLARSSPPGVETGTYSSLEEALREAGELPERQLICGSLYLCGEALSFFGRGAFEPSSQ